MPKKPYFILKEETLQLFTENKNNHFLSQYPVFTPVANAAKELQIEANVIGGWVRDLLLGRNSKDIDIVTPGSGINLAKTTAKQINNSKVSIFKNFGTAMIKSGDIELEFVGARKESYSRNSRNPEVAPGTIADDQNRRDFTINALSIGLTGEALGKIIDPFNGIEDLQNGIIRTPLDPVKTYTDDPLRMLRAIRFASQLGFQIEKKSFQAIAANKDRIKIISIERVAIELEKIMLSPQPSVGLLLLEQTGLLKMFIPELTALKGVSEEEGQKHKENFIHTLEVVDNISAHTQNVWLRYAALFHDIGKAPTKRFVKGTGFTFRGHEAVGAKMIPAIFKRLKLPLDAKMRYVKKLVYLSSRPIALINEHVTDSGVRRLLFDAGEDIDDLMTLCNADITSKNPYRVKRYKQNFVLVRQKMKEVEERDHITNFQPPISGQEIMTAFNIKPGKEIGVIKTDIKNAILDGQIPNKKEAARELMLKIGMRLGLNPA